MEVATFFIAAIRMANCSNIVRKLPNVNKDVSAFLNSAFSSLRAVRWVDASKFDIKLWLVLISAPPIPWTPSPECPLGALSENNRSIRLFFGGGLLGTSFNTFFPPLTKLCIRSSEMPNSSTSPRSRAWEPSQHSPLKTWFQLFDLKEWEQQQIERNESNHTARSVRKCCGWCPKR